MTAHERWAGRPSGNVPTNVPGIRQRALAIRLSCIVSVDGLTIAATITNHATTRVACDVAWWIDADFADVQKRGAETASKRPT
jgi:hypothetical protein